MSKWRERQELLQEYDRRAFYMDWEEFREKLKKLNKEVASGL